MAGLYAYVADRGVGLQVVDVSNPTNPVQISTYGSNDYFEGVVVAGNYAFVANWDGLKVLDVTNPAHTVQVYDSSAFASGVAVAGTYAYVSDGAAGVEVIDVSRLTSPVRVGGYKTSGYADGILLRSNRAYITSPSVGLQILDVSSPAHPVLLGNYGTNRPFEGVDVVGGYAYVANGDAGLQILDVSNPVAPMRVGGYHTGGHAYGVAVAGNYAYVADGWDLLIIDISQPASPVQVGRTGSGPPWDYFEDAVGVMVSGGYAFVAFNGDGPSGGLGTIDVSNPANPTWSGYAGSFPPLAGTSSPSHGTQIAVVGRNAYGPWGIVDVSAPAQPVLVGGYGPAGTPRGVYIMGDYAYLADGNNGLMIMKLNLGQQLLPGTLSYSSGHFQFTLQGPPGSLVEIQTSTNLMSWVPIATLTNQTGQLSFTDPGANCRMLFYRARQLP